MRTRLISTFQIDAVMFIAYLRDDMFVAASPDKLIWFDIKGSIIHEVRRSSHDGRSFSLLPIRNHLRSVIQLETEPSNFSLRLLDENGFEGTMVAVPFSWINQVTSDSSGSLLAAYGSVILPDRSGWIAPVESCLIDMKSGQLQRLSYSAVAIHENLLYFVCDNSLYRRVLSTSLCLSRMSNVGASIDAADLVATGIPSGVIALAASNGIVRMATEDGIYVATSSGLARVHQWCVCSRAIISGDNCFSSDIGPEVQIYDAKRHFATSVTSSSNTQVTGFDVRSSLPGEGNDGTLLVVSESGVVDCFSWNCS